MPRLSSTSSPTSPPAPESSKRGGIPIAILAWLLGVPAVIVILLLLL
jgi:hypothetical protein